MRKVGNGIYVAGGYVNSYIVDGDQGVTLIDTGLPKKDGLITNALVEIGRKLSDVKAIVLTHSHNDHAGGAAVLKQATGATLIASSIDSPAIEGTEPVPAPPMLPGAFSFLTKLMPKASPAMVDLMVTEAAQVGMPDDLQVIDTPGHTPGHTSYLLDRDAGVVFVGDAAMTDRNGAVVPGFINRGGGKVLRDSIVHMAEFNFESALFGHSAPLKTGADRLFRAFRP